MSDEPLHPAENDLAHVAARTIQDGFLDDLLMDADRGLPSGIVVLVNGMIIMGRLGTPESMAEELDAARRQTVSASTKPDDMDDETWAEAQERYGAKASRGVQARREDEKQLERDAEPHSSEDGLELDAVPAELARRVIAGSLPPHLTIEDARITAPGQVGLTRVPVMRVAVMHVTAWWLLQTDEQGRASVTLWEMDTEEQPDEG